jgi:hypothetical protein
VVPAATRMLEQSLKRGAKRGGGFSGFGALDTSGGAGSKGPGKGTSTGGKYESFKSINVVEGGGAGSKVVSKLESVERGPLGNRKRQ